MGLDESEHIGKIALDPRDSQTVWVAAQGPLWRAGGDRGLYKTTDGGANWEHVLRISDDTGVSDVVLDPRNPDIVYASAWQRRRHTGLQIAGGPEGGIHKSEDGGVTWRKLSNGLPSPDRQDIGRIGLAISPHDPDVVYAQIAASDGGYGFYASTDRGESWEEAERLLRHRSAVLHGDLCRPAPARPSLLHGHLHPRFRRRRQDLAAAEHPVEARGPPRYGVRPRRPELPDDEHRRRSLRKLGIWASTGSTTRTRR